MKKNREGKPRSVTQRQRLQMLLLGGSGLFLAGLITLAGVGKGRAVQSLKRPVSTEGYSYRLQVRLGEERLGEVRVEVPGRLLPEKECRELVEEAAGRLSQDILGKNEDLNRVYDDLCLPTTSRDGLVEISWESNDFELIDSAGRVKNRLLTVERVVELSARLRCRNVERTVAFPVRVLPPKLDQRGVVEREVALLALEESEAERERPQFALPDNYAGKALSWATPNKPYGLWVTLWTAAGCAGIYAIRLQDRRKEDKKREEDLRLAYPGFLARLTMMAGTGMPLRKVFSKISANEGTVYKEVHRACRDMEGGLTQSQAFEAFGQRCGLPQYKKCAALLGQNLRRGSDGFLDALWQEAENALEERRSLARKKGEEAQTKLLFPMILLLLVSMVFIMVPACFSFGTM